MEKFTKWADKGTHVNPFLPLRPPAAKGAGAKVVGFVGGLVLLALRLPLLLVAAGWLALASLLAHPLATLAGGAGLLAASASQDRPDLQQPGIVVAGIGLAMLVLRPLRSLVAALLVRPALGLLVRVLGLAFVEQHANLRKLGLRPPGYKAPTGRVGASVRGGDLLVGNHTSLLEVLYFASRFSPLFAGAAVAPEVSFHALSLFGALWRASHVPPREGKGQGLDALVRQARAEGKPLALFPEVARSNGEGILAFPRSFFDGLGKDDQPVRAHLFTFSAPKGEVLAAHTVGPALGFLLRLLTTRRTTVLVTYVGAEDAPVFKKGVGGGGNNAAAWGEEARALMAATLGKPKLAVGYADSLTFGQYWRATRQGDAATAARLADARDKI